MVRSPSRKATNATPGRNASTTRFPIFASVGQGESNRVASFAPQFLVADLEHAIRSHEELGFTFGQPWEGFYAIGHLDGLELHLKEAPANPEERRQRRDNAHLDAAAGVDGIEAFFTHCVANGATILKPLAPTAWGTKDFYVEDPDGNIICFGGRPASE